MNASQNCTYYRRFFGFDPQRDKQKLADGSGYYYEEFFPLPNDPLLLRASVSIGARVVHVGGHSLNKIIFRRGTCEFAIECVHTAIYSLPIAQIEELCQTFTDPLQAIELARSTEKHHIILPPEEHFAALKSYVAGIAEVGIATMLKSTYFDINGLLEALPFGFNVQMQRKVIKALLVVAPSESRAFLRDALIEIAEHAPVEWFMSRLALIADIFPFWEIVISDPVTFDAVNEIFQFPAFRYKVAKIPFVHPQILTRLGRDPDYFVRRNVAKNLNAPTALLEELAMDANEEVRMNVACNPNTPPFILGKLANDMNPTVSREGTNRLKDLHS